MKEIKLFFIEKICKQKTHKFLLMIPLIFIFSTDVYALEISAGPDKVICQEGETVLEGSASGSVNDIYTYSWEPTEDLTCDDCEEPIANPTVTTIYTLTVEDSGGFVCTDEVVVTVAELTVRPIDSDFETEKKGRIMISTTQDDVYYTSKITTKDNLVAQTEDGKIKITAYLTPVEEVEGQIVYFRSIDPDDASPYEKIEGTNDEDLGGGDNRDVGVNGIGSGILSASSAVVELRTIDGVDVAVAEVVLTITKQYSGDNYQVEACLDNNFEGCGVAKTAVLVAWKRVYLEIAKMYQKGATITEVFQPDNNNDPDKLMVDNTSDFTVGDEIEVFVGIAIGMSSEVFSTTRTIISKSTNSITVDDLPSQLGDIENLPYFKYSGIKLVGNDNANGPLLSGLDETYGDLTNGSDGGCFVEFVENGVIFLPKYTLFVSTTSLTDFLVHWYVKEGYANQLLLANIHAATIIGPEGGIILGYTKPGKHISLIINSAMNEVPLNTPDEIFNVIESVVSHELGHQFKVESTHVDKKAPLGEVLNHEGTDFCIMSYTDDKSDTEIEFDEICLNQVRKAVDPL